MSTDYEVGPWRRGRFRGASADIRSDVRSRLLVRAPNGLEHCWAGVGFDDPDDVRQALARNADAVAAVLDGSASCRPNYDQLQLPVLGYRGDRERLDDNDALMARLDAEVHVLSDATHLVSFNGADEVLEWVVPLARRHAARGSTAGGCRCSSSPRRVISRVRRRSWAITSGARGSGGWRLGSRGRCRQGRGRRRRPPCSSHQGSSPPKSRQHRPGRPHRR